jgi:chemotaxis protein methyltransferase CheR
MKAMQAFEVELVLQAIEHRWGYDFRGYARTSITRRIENVMRRHQICHVSELIPRVLHEPVFFDDMVSDFSITVTQMFRDPPVWKKLLLEVLPLLETYPFFKIWHAACATGEEVYSMAILLQEAGLLERATLYATDFNDTALAYARSGRYPKENMVQAEENYLAAGGVHTLDNYYYAQGNSVEMHQYLKSHIVWANHNLTCDHSFGEMNLILCRNVLIYFTQPLQNRALELFAQSLSGGGVLCLGSRESLSFSSVASRFSVISSGKRLYKYKN